MSEKKSTILRLTESVVTLVGRFHDFRSFSDQRIRDLEDRLALLDGKSPEDARREAYDAVNAARRRNGESELGIERL